MLRLLLEKRMPRRNNLPRDRRDVRGIEKGSGLDDGKVVAHAEGIIFGCGHRCCSGYDRACRQRSSRRDERTSIEIRHGVNLGVSQNVRQVTSWPTPGVLRPTSSSMTSSPPPTITGTSLALGTNASGMSP